MCNNPYFNIGIIFYTIYRYISSRMHISYILIPFLFFLLIYSLYFSDFWMGAALRRAIFPSGINTTVFLILILKIRKKCVWGGEATLKRQVI